MLGGGQGALGMRRPVVPAPRVLHDREGSAAIHYVERALPCKPEPGLPACCLLLRSDWRRGQCGGYSVSVLLRELDRRRLVLAREETVDGKRVCIFRNLAC